MLAKRTKPREAPEPVSDHKPPRPRGRGGRFIPTGRPPADESREPNQIARRARRQAAKAAKPAPTGPARDARGRILPGHQVTRVGRTKGAQDKLPRGSVKAVLQQLIAQGDGHEKMLKAFDAGIQADPKTALGYLDLAAKVLDKADEMQGKFVHFHLHTNVDFTKLDEAARKNGMVPPLARRVAPESGE
jgi:hypothetical protein